MSDEYAFRRYTGPQEFDKAIHTLEGLLSGIAIDEKISEAELSGVRDWIDQHRHRSDRHPFNEIFPVLDSFLADGILDDDEHADLVWLCQRLRTDERYFDSITSDMQRLQGVLGGIAVDGEINEDELRGLQDWLADHDHLRSCYPYDEVDSLIHAVLRDGTIDENEHKLLIAFFTEFIGFRGHRAIDFPLNEVGTPITGLCAVAPEVTFTEKCFCFTGKSSRLSRAKLAALVEENGGKFSKGVNQTVHYLIIGNDGNPAWAFACYGRKVEKAIEMRREGHQILIVHETDFWDCLQDV